MSFLKDTSDPRGSGTTWFHEHGHYVDNNLGYPSHKKTFADALRKDYTQYVKGYQSEHGIAHIQEARKAIGAELSRKAGEMHAISDLFGGCSKNKCVDGYGHWRDGYWDTPYALEHEAFAHMFEANFSKQKAKTMEHFFPNAWVEMSNMLKEVP